MKIHISIKLVFVNIFDLFDLLLAPSISHLIRIKLSVIVSLNGVAQEYESKRHQRLYC